MDHPSSKFRNKMSVPNVLSLTDNPQVHNAVTGEKSCWCIYNQTVADLRGCGDKIIGWRPLLEGTRPLLRGILDPSLPNINVHDMP